MGEQNIKKTDNGQTDINKMIYCAFNMICMLILLFHSFSVLGLLSTIVITVVVFFVLLGSDEETPACGYLAIIVFADVVNYILIKYDVLKANYNAYHLGDFIDLMGNLVRNYYIVMLAVSILGIIVSFVKNAPYIVTAFFSLIIGMSFIYVFWNGGNLKNPDFKPGFWATTILFLVLILVWTFVAQITVLANEEAVRWVNSLSIILLLFYCSFIVLYNQYCTKLSFELYDIVSAGFENIFAWWKVILLIVILVALAVAMYDSEEFTLGADALVYIGFASLILMIKILSINYFLYNFLILILLCIGVLLCLKHECDDEDTFRLESEFFLIVQFIALIAAVFMLKYGLWINVLLSVVFGIMFYLETEGLEYEEYRNLYCIEIIICIAIEAIAAAWQLSFSYEILFTILFMAAIALATIVVVGWSNLQNEECQDVSRVLIIMGLALLCFMLLHKNGVKFTTEYDAENDKVTIDVVEKGIDNSIKKITCYWCDMNGKQISAEEEFTVNSFRIPVEGERLNIICVDKKGVTSKAVRWFNKIEDYIN